MVLGAALGNFFHGQTQKKKEQELQSKLDKAEDTAANIVKRAEERYRKAELLSKDMVDKAHSESEKRMQKIDQLETRLVQKEERIDQKLETLEKQKEQLQQKEGSIEKLIEEQKTVLAQVAGITQEQARETLFSRIEITEKEEIIAFRNKFQAIKQEEADKDAASILAKVLPRISMNSVSEFTVSLVELPSEDMKGKLIGRE